MESFIAGRMGTEIGLKRTNFAASTNLKFFPCLAPFTSFLPSVLPWGAFKDASPLCQRPNLGRLPSRGRSTKRP